MFSTKDSIFCPTCKPCREKRRYLTKRKTSSSLSAKNSNPINLNTKKYTHHHIRYVDLFAKKKNTYKKTHPISHNEQDPSVNFANSPMYRKLNGDKQNPAWEGSIRGLTAVFNGSSDREAFLFSGPVRPGVL